MAMVEGFFGDSFMEDDPNAGLSGGELPMMPDGKKVIRITAARVDDLPWKVSPKNPDGRTLVVTIEQDGHKPAEDQIPLNLRGVVARVCEAAGIDRPQSGESYGSFCERLTGCSAPVETALAVAKSGREYIQIQWLKGLPGAPAAAKAETRAKPVAKRQAKPAAAPVVDEAPDDIPF